MKYLLGIPAGALEGVGDLADGDGMAVGVLDGDIGLVLDALTADVLQVDIVDGGLRLGDVGHLLRHEILRLVQQFRHFPVLNSSERYGPETTNEKLGSFLSRVRDVLRVNGSVSATWRMTETNGKPL